MAEFRKCFHAIDVKNTGKITMEDLREYMKKMNYTEKFVTSWMKLFPFTEGVITYEQYCNTLGLIPRKHVTELVEPDREMSATLRRKESLLVATGERSEVETPKGLESTKEGTERSPLFSSEAYFSATESSTCGDSLGVVQRHPVDMETHSLTLDHPQTQAELQLDLSIPEMQPVDMQVDTELKWDTDNLEASTFGRSSLIEIPTMQQLRLSPIRTDLMTTQQSSHLDSSFPEECDHAQMSPDMQSAFALNGMEVNVFEPIDTAISMGTNDSQVTEEDLESAPFGVPTAKQHTKRHKREHYEIESEKDMSENEQASQSIDTGQWTVINREKRKPRRSKKTVEQKEETRETCFVERQAVEKDVEKKHDKSVVILEDTDIGLSSGDSKTEKRRKKKDRSPKRKTLASEQGNLTFQQASQMELTESMFGDHIFLKDPVITPSESVVKTKGKKQKSKERRRQHVDDDVEQMDQVLDISHTDGSPVLDDFTLSENYSIMVEEFPVIPQSISTNESLPMGCSPQHREEHVFIQATEFEEMVEEVQEHTDTEGDTHWASQELLLLQVAETQQHHMLDTHSTEIATDQHKPHKQKLTAIDRTDELSSNFGKAKTIRFAPQIKIHSASTPTTTKQQRSKNLHERKGENGAFSILDRNEDGSVKKTLVVKPRRLPKPPMITNRTEALSVCQVTGTTEKMESKEHSKQKPTSNIESSQPKRKNKALKGQHQPPQQENQIGQILRNKQSREKKRITQKARLRSRIEAKAHQKEKDRIKERRKTRFPRSFTVQADPDLHERKDKQRERNNDRLMERRLKDRFQTTDSNLRKKNKKPPTVLERWRLRPSLRGRGMVVILLAGIHRGKRVVCLGRHKSTGLLLVTGPFRYNGCPLRRVHPSMVIVTKTRIDLGKVRLLSSPSAW
ncbi:unnamed protein product [Dicrocoelium dendriticum]|nr:unnamed protein product [Dicrocoelium dendriticum]